MPLSHEDSDLVARLTGVQREQYDQMERLDAYYDGRQRLEHLGLSAPSQLLRRFETVVNVPRMAVDEPVRRQVLKAFHRSGSSVDDPVLREAWEANNLDSQAPLVHKDARVYGRGVVTVSENEDDHDHPFITVEDPRQFSVLIDNRRRRMSSALRLWRDDADRREMATLYLPDRTMWLSQGTYGWVVDDVNEHRLGRVPVVLFLNRPRAGRWGGTSEMADVMALTDGVARLITNMLVAAETHAVPDKWVAGVSQGDFVGKDGKPLPTWETYFAAIKATANEKARFGQFAASDLKNFHDSVNNMLAWCAAVLGLPTRYAGQQSVNPAAEGAIRADEARLIRNVELMNAGDGDSWAWVMGLYERIRTDEWVANNEIRTLWHDPATPTKSQSGDYIMKLHAEGILSKEGAWDELGWDEARKDRERSYFESEAADPTIAQVLREVRGVDSGVDAGPVPAGATADGVGVGGGA